MLLPGVSGAIFQVKRDPSEMDKLSAKVKGTKKSIVNKKNFISRVKPRSQKARLTECVIAKSNFATR